MYSPLVLWSLVWFSGLAFGFMFGRTSKRTRNYEQCFEIEAAGDGAVMLKTYAVEKKEVAA